MHQVCCALSQIAKHSVDLAEVVVGAEIFPKILTCLKFPDEFVKKHAATVVREIAKHTPELAQLVVGNGGVGALVDYVGESSGNNRLPGTMALGYIAADTLQHSGEYPLTYCTICLVGVSMAVAHARAFCTIHFCNATF
jgi:hypothetical protein